MNLGNPFSSGRRIFALLVLGPLAAVVVSISMIAAGYQHYSPTPGEIRTVTENQGSPGSNPRDGFWNPALAESGWTR
jgi:hypothetical protein